MPKVSLGPWVPDFGPLGNTGVMEAKNVLPHAQGYKPFRAPVTVEPAGSLVGLPISGAFYCESAGGNHHYLAGVRNSATSTLARVFYLKEVHQPTASWRDVTNVTASWSHSVNWRFCCFNNLAIAIPGNPTVTKTPLRLSLSLSAGTQFNELGGTPPAGAAHIGTVRDFVVIASVLNALNRVQWSALGNAEDWVTSATTQSDAQDFLNEGRITGFIGGEYGLIFFVKAIYRMSYIGPPAIFQFDKISEYGAYYGSATRLGESIYFLGEQGFGVVRSGFEALILSSDSIDQYLKENVLAGLPFLDLTTDQVDMAADPRDRVVYMSYSDPATVLGSADKRTNLIFYDESLDKFSRASLTHQRIFPMFMRKFGSLAGFGGAGFSVSFQHFVGVFDESNNLSVFEGDNMKYLIETGEGQLNENGRTFVNKVIPYVHGTHAPMVRVGVRERQHQTVSFGATVTANTTNGECAVRAAGRFHRLQIMGSVSASWSLATGFEVQGRPDGTR